MKRKNKKNQQKPKEEIAEDYCFICKDGGDLLICEYKQCLKTYHFDCVQKDTSLSTSKEKWVCDWHSCMICHKTSQVHCYCCPKATCWRCLEVAELVNVKGKYGFCGNCLKLALLIEDNRDADSDGEKVDFKDRETCEGLFMEYYKIIQEKEGFSADNLRAAKNRLQAGKNILSGSEEEESGDEEEEEMTSEEDMDSIRGYKPKHKNKRFKKELPVMKYVKSKRMQFSGWGSTSLIKFLKSIGEDTSQKLSQHDVYFMIRRYITENNLFDPAKKKHVVCDENLHSIFQRKAINKNKIFGLLEAHFLENLEESEEDEATHDSEYKDEPPLVTCKTKKLSKPEKGSPKRDAILNAPHSCYASVTAENIQCVYLRRSLVAELSKQPESFERKVIGSFVRVKSDPHDYYQRNSHQLVQVTGIVKSIIGESNAEIILCVSKIPKEVGISLLSDGDFTEEECEDLRRQVTDGLVQKPTVVELQEKARSLHVDITKHWIARELKLLDYRIRKANEKGWRREFFDCIDKKKLLETPSEQSRLLENHPMVIPDVADPEPSNQDTVDDQKPDEALLQSIFSINHNRNLEEVPNVAYHEATSRDTVDEQKEDEAVAESIFPLDLNDKSRSNGISSVEDEEYRADLFVQEGKHKPDTIDMPVSPHNSTSTYKRGELELSILEERTQQILLTGSDQHEVNQSQQNADANQAATVKQERLVDEMIEYEVNQSQENTDAKQAMTKKQELLADEMIEHEAKQSQENADAKQATMKKQEILADEVIEVSSDDESEPNAAVERQRLEDPESMVWLISGPDGIERKRTYSLSLLKRWSEASSYAFRFKVWKEDQSQEQAISLRDAINLAFPGL